MKRKVIKIYMLHPFVHDVDSLERYLHIHSCNNLEYEFAWNETEPDYFIASEHIWKSIVYWKKFVKIYRKSKIHIYHAGECNFPNLNLFDYAICFDKHLSCDDRIVRMPTRLFFANLIFDSSNILTLESDSARKELQMKSYFCNFMYSNKRGHIKRTEIFYKINEYKQVDSLGKYLNNKTVPMQAKSTDGWAPVIKESIQIKRNYKFSIAFENACYAGYTSEKIWSSLAAHTVPIYWGNPFIAEELNEEAFINCHRYENFDAVLKKIREIDENDEMWCKMVSQPWLTPEQEEAEKVEIKKYYEFLNHIFMQPIECANRKGEGTFQEIYLQHVFNSRNPLLALKEYLYSGGRKCKKYLKNFGNI